MASYLLSASVLTPILGRLGDMVGKRRIMILVLMLLLAGRVLAALAPNLGVLIVARVLQGAAGTVMPLSIGIVRDELPHDKVGVTLGLLSAILGALALVVFVVVELRVKEPLIDMRLFKIRGVWTANVVGLVFGFAMFGTFVLVPTLLQLPTVTGYGFGESVSSAGLFLLPTVLMMVVFGPVAGILVRKIGPKPPMVFGALFVTAEFVIPALNHAELWQVVVSGQLTGAGIGLAFVAMSNAIIESVPIHQTGEASSVDTIARTIGSSIGTAVIAALITSHGTSQGLPLDDAFTIGFWVCAAVAVLAIISALAAPSMSKRREQAPALGVEDLD
ncbi:MFS transporter [Cryobacterium sp. GrIS_2_6]|uniref:MFS transporter n=1 Tax=Cryobacterium sp. GrIS_2_6 TaxID=3162785 RepID=UPI002DFE3402|nr:MFS family permease [Cryobacterium psychrotolerans]